jgi:RNase P subunit RPR2
MEVRMTEAIVESRYKAVLCRRCRQPIPVPAIVNRLRAEEQNVERVFTVRCRVCENESLYHSRLVIEVQGEPKRRRVAADAVYAEKPFSRAANA